ncbi:phosphatase PAP2 family protein [Streptomyces sp. DH12]|uniref:phosphatase PAP2 family protein n=1 Tax=Streptomyces sp. DH12 TaxID=2857010 RepID=UPI001E42EC60|nr:phosphatase PAP2 family protein [Streptomyces sp. DH12]
MPGRSAERRAAWQRLRSPRHPRIWFEILLIAVSYGVYSLIRNAVPEQKAQALRNADWIWRAEHSLGLAFEKTVNHAADSVGWLIVSMNYYYATLHFVVTVGVLVWLYRRHPGRYAAIRMVLFSTTAVALLGYYLYPLAPPRLMEGENFIDTVLVHQTWGSMASGDLKHMSNQYAAMPSMHIGWSLWCGLAVFALAKAPWARILGLLYPTATLVVIVATANHFWLDAVGGLLCVGFGLAVVSLWYGALPHRLPRYAAPRRGRGAGAPDPAAGVPGPAVGAPVAAASEAAVGLPDPVAGIPAAGVPVAAASEAAVAPAGPAAAEAGPAPAVGAGHAP